MTLTASSSRRLLLVSALSLSLSGVAGCATPTSPIGATPTAVEVAQAGPAPAQLTEQPAAPSAPAAAPAGAAVRALSLQGAARFYDEPLSGYAVKAWDALTGAEHAVSGAAVTDREGKFQVSLAGVKPGQFVRVLAMHGRVAVEATFQAGEQGQAGVVLNQTSTFLSQLAAGPLEVAGWLDAEKARPVAEGYMGALAKLEAPAAQTLTAHNALGGVLVRSTSTPAERLAQDNAYQSLLDNTSQAQLLTTAAAQVVTAVANGGQPAVAAPYQLLAADGPRVVRFRGTQLQAGRNAGGPIRLTNVVSGKTVDAASPTAVAAVTKVKRSRSRRAAASFNFPQALLPFFRFSLGQQPQTQLDSGFLTEISDEAGVGHPFRIKFNGTAAELTEDGLYLANVDNFADPASTAYWMRLNQDSRKQLTSIDLPYLGTFMTMITAATSPVEFNAQTLTPEAFSVAAPAPGVTATTYRFQVTVLGETYPARVTVFTDSAREVVGFRMLPVMEAGFQVFLAEGATPSPVQGLLLTYFMCEAHRAALDESWTPFDWQAYLASLLPSQVD